MIVNPNERPGTGIVSNSTRKMPRWKKILLIILAVHLVFTVLDACVFHGPCAMKLISATGPGRLVIDRLEYRVRHRQNEIEMTWTEAVVRDRSLWGEGEKHSRTIPLDPLPPEFARCYVDVTVDPDAPAMFPMPFNAEYLAPIPSLGEQNVIGTDPEIAPEARRWDLPPDMVFHLRVRPKDVSALSEQFALSPGKHAYTLLVPYPNAGNGLREMLMSTTRDSYRPYSIELEQEARSRPRKMPSKVVPMLSRIVMLPIAVIPDYFADIALLLWALSSPM